MVGNGTVEQWKALGFMYSSGSGGGGGTSSSISSSKKTRVLKLTTLYNEKLRRTISVSTKNTTILV